MIFHYYRYYAADKSGIFDHYLFWIDLGRAAKCFRKQRRNYYNYLGNSVWIDVEDGVKGKYCQALNAEVESFQRVLGKR